MIRFTPPYVLRRERGDLWSLYLVDGTPLARCTSAAAAIAAMRLFFGHGAPAAYAHYLRGQLGGRTDRDLLDAIDVALRDERRRAFDAWLRETGFVGFPEWHESGVVVGIDFEAACGKEVP